MDELPAFPVTIASSAPADVPSANGFRRASDDEANQEDRTVAVVFEERCRIRQSCPLLTRS